MAGNRGAPPWYRFVFRPDYWDPLVSPVAHSNKGGRTINSPVQFGFWLEFGGATQGGVTQKADQEQSLAGRSLQGRDGPPLSGMTTDDSQCAPS